MLFKGPKDRMKATYEIIEMLPARIQEKYKMISTSENETETIIVLAHKEGFPMIKVVEYTHYREELQMVTLYQEEIEAIRKHLKE